MPTDEGYDDPQNVLDSDFRGEYIEDLEAKQLEERIKDQYKKFEDLGNDLFLNSELKISNNNKADILKNLMVYVDKNYINISSIDSLDDNSNRLLTEGDYVYQFICVDSVSSLIPAFMEMIKAETIDDLDEQIRDEPDAMDWLLTNSIEAYANVLRTGNDFKAKHTNEETLEMLTEFDNPVLKELESTYYYDYESWEYDNDFVKENGVRPKDIKNRFGLKYPKLNSNKSFGKIIRDAFDLDKKEGESDAGYYVTTQFRVDGATETYIVGLHKRQLKNS